MWTEVCLLAVVYFNYNPCYVSRLFLFHTYFVANLLNSQLYNSFTLDIKYKKGPPPLGTRNLWQNWKQLLEEEKCTKKNLANLATKSDKKMASKINRDITLCSPLKDNQRFGGTCHLHLQSWRVHQARNHHEAGSKQTRELFIISNLKSYKIWLLYISTH
jgi:hypothetical protein